MHLKVGDVQKLVTAANKAKLLEQDIVVYKTDIQLLNGQIANLMAQLVNASRSDSVNAHTIQLYKDQIQLMKDNRTDLEGKVTVLEKEVRSLRRKQFWTSVGGLVGILGALFLYFTK